MKKTNTIASFEENPVKLSIKTLQHIMGGYTATDDLWEIVKGYTAHDDLWELRKVKK